MDKGLLQRDVAILLKVDQDSVTGWEIRRYKPQVRHYPAIIAFLDYYPFDHETDTLPGKIRCIRYCKGYSYKQFGTLLGVDASTVRDWEQERFKAPIRIHDRILHAWLLIPHILPQQYLSH